jgi:hypothetical protein
VGVRPHLPAPNDKSVSRLIRRSGSYMIFNRCMQWRMFVRVAVVNRQFALRTFGSVEKPIGSDYRMPDGT